MKNAASQRSARGAAARRGLTVKDFTRVSTGGFGDSTNRVAHSMAWFENQLYVGTTRDRMRPPLSSDQPEGAEIWRYSPETGRWELAYKSPSVRAPDGRFVARDLGYRGMVVLQGVRDESPALYVTTISALGALVLRSVDGCSFHPVSPAGMENPKNVSYRTLIPFRGRLYVWPAGRSGSFAESLEQDLSLDPLIYESPDPASGIWQPICEPGFGDVGNLFVFDMAVLKDELYAGTFNPVSGYQVWKTAADGPPPYRWTRVLDNGAGRGAGNETVASLCAFKGALYVGSGIPGFGYDRVHQVGRAAAELVRVNPDMTWDLIVGEQRGARQGWKGPLSGYGPGFGNPFNSAIWRMVEHEGYLYAGTYDWSSYLWFLLQRGRGRRGAVMARTLRQEAGFDLWRSGDGVHWVPVTTSAFGAVHNHGLRTFASTPYGLFVGTVGLPLPASRMVERRPGEPGAGGGLEIWLGR